ncbi:MAG: glycosyltransferase family 39 protein, partial [Candidatus Omnitrophota bacterium]
MDINKKLIIFILITATILCAVGILAGYSLGDEVQHFRMSREMFMLNKRPVFDSVYGQGTAPGYFYNWEPFWHIGLAIAWKVFTKPYFPIAQVYHTLYFILLLMFTYRLSKRLYTRETGFYSVLILATVPMIISFSILFYLDVPAITFGILCTYLLVRKRFIWAGLVLGIIFIVKRSLYFFIPSFIFIVLYRSRGLKEKIKNLFLFFCMPLAVGIIDLFWRQRLFIIKTGEGAGSVMDISTFSGIVHFLKEKYI